MSDAKKIVVDYEALESGSANAIHTAGAALSMDYDWLFDLFFPWRQIGRALESFFGESDSVSRGDAQRIETLIQKGREHGVDEMEIRLDRERIAGLKGKVCTTDSADVEVLVGGDGKSKATIRVKYK